MKALSKWDEKMRKYFKEGYSYDIPELPENPNYYTSFEEPLDYEHDFWEGNGGVNTQLRRTTERAKEGTWSMKAQWSKPAPDSYLDRAFYAKYLGFTKGRVDTWIYITEKTGYEHFLYGLDFGTYSGGYVEAVISNEAEGQGLLAKVLPQRTALQKTEWTQAINILPGYWHLITAIVDLRANPGSYQASIELYINRKRIMTAYPTANGTIRPDYGLTFHGSWMNPNPPSRTVCYFDPFQVTKID